MYFPFLFGTLTHVWHYSRWCFTFVAHVSRQIWRDNDLSFTDSFKSRRFSSFCFLFLLMESDMHVRILYRPLKQWCVVLWSDHPFYTLLKVNTEYKHVGEPYCLRSLLWKSTVALWLRICLFCLIFWHLDEAHPACVVIINVLCAV